MTAKDMMKCYQELEIDAPADKVWELIKDPFDLSYLPSTHKLEVNAARDTRIVHIIVPDSFGHPGGIMIAPELVYNLDHDTRSYNYTYNGADLPIDCHVAFVQVEDRPNGKSLFTWQCIWRLKVAMPPAEEQKMIDYVEGLFIAGMRNAKKIVEAR